MIDKLDFRVAPEIPFNSDFHAMCRLRGRPRTNEYYKQVLDLRPLALPALLQIGCRYNGTNKLSFLGTSAMHLSDIVAMLVGVFDCDMADIGVVRIDFAADVNGLPVEWFREHLRIRYKRTQHEVGCRSQGVGESSPTMYLGQGADRIRIYDKVAEGALRRNNSARGRFDLDTRRVELNNPAVLTRIERQFRSGRVPPILGSAALLERNISEFDPFENVMLFAGGKSELRVRDYGLSRYLKGQGLRSEIQKHGLARVWDLANECSGGNAGRLFKSLSDFIPPSPPVFEMPNISEIYRQSLNRQIAEPSMGESRKEESGARS